MRTLLGSVLVLLGGCVGGLDSTGAGDFGATPGGVKDLRLARELIANGQVPPADALLVEAMFAEHELGLEGAACDRTLCLRGAAGFAPEIDGEPRGWAQVGLSSMIDPATWARPSTTFVFTVDVSGSMGWGGRDDEYPTAGSLSRKLLHALTGELRPDDRVAIVTYGSDVSTALGLTSGANQSEVRDAIDELDTNGSTNMEAGMERAYSIGASALGSTDQVRVIVFTDVQPNVGSTSGSAFETMVRDAAARDVHTSVLALGLGIGPTVMRAMASLRGANAYSLTKSGDVDEFMADDYPWFTTPLAYGLRVNASLDNQWSIARGLGFPAASDAAEIGLKAETVFLSRRKGALLLALAPPAGTEGPQGLAGRFSLAYSEPSGEEIAVDVPFAYDGGAVDARGQWFAQHAVGRTAALGLLVEAMHDAAVDYATAPETSAAILHAASERFAADAAALGDEDLPVEVELVRAMTTLVEARAPQGTLYGAY
jgi:Ca-activated chloride channel family protein